MNDAPPPVTLTRRRKSFFQRASFVWLIPLLALAIALGVAWQSYTSRGPLIEVTFANGAGITKRQTELRYRDVAVGVVEDVRFSEDLSRVVAVIRLSKSVAPFVDADSSFWVVRPEVSARGVTGLDTVLSGVYIEGAWDSEIGRFRARFEGQEDAPLIRYGKEGLVIKLRTTAGGSMTDDSPILYRGIEVGRVGKATIAEGGSNATADAIIYTPHEQLISPTTRFWDTSGFTFSVGPSGAEIDFSSFATLVGGGLTFDTFVSGGGGVKPGAVFEVFEDAAAARNSLFNASEVEALEMRVIFDENISGLAVDAPVEISGLRIGKVQSVSGMIDADAFGDERVRLSAVLAIQPARLGLQESVTPTGALRFLSDRVAQGLRARLASASLLTGGLKIELVEVEDAAPFELTVTEGVMPVLPTTQSEITDASATVEGVLTRVNNLPIEELLKSAIDFLESAKALAADDNVRSVPKDLRELLAEIAAIVSSEEVKNIPVALNSSLSSFETLMTQFEEQELANKLVEALGAAAAAGQGITASIEGVPSLVERLNSVATMADELPLPALVERLSSLADSADTLVGSEAAQALPDEANAALTQLTATLTELREADSIANINAALTSARKAADAVTTSTEGLPELIARVDSVAAMAETLPLPELVERLSALASSADLLIGTEEARALPADASAALSEVTATLSELRAGGSVQNINAALESARKAADAVSESTRDLPALIERIESVAAMAQDLPLPELVERLSTLTESANALIGSQDAQEIPAELKQALDQITATLSELREGGAVKNVNATLDSARRAADAVAISARDLPSLVVRIRDVLNQAGTTIAGYNKGEALSRDARDTLRDISAAADALTSLARMLERNPSALIRGR
ncbi:hypothetical protein BV394_04335 [Brevirhabdus pacifica]|uniref:Uncharacterized protein n=1 Tax=Brevirhabdus pacifica TaxID=1267768 RepID=A0A1U7DGP8_9RHOB|nr:MlaD family protein [Brevirhabdus pacifica]APX89048.1 hypothetical protein BV394_04335 [Brevirhabdus pacifica]PJJ86379.1 paraquat-inducible protein B [Brevirhabdus pacifica]